MERLDRTITSYDDDSAVSLNDELFSLDSDTPDGVSSVEESTGNLQPVDNLNSLIETALCQFEFQVKQLNQMTCGSYPMMAFYEDHDKKFTFHHNMIGFYFYQLKVRLMIELSEFSLHDDELTSLLNESCLCSTCLLKKYESERNITLEPNIYDELLYYLDPCIDEDSKQEESKMHQVQIYTTNHEHHILPDYYTPNYIAQFYCIVRVQLITKYLIGLHSLLDESVLLNASQDIMFRNAITSLEDKINQSLLDRINCTRMIAFHVYEICKEAETQISKHGQIEKRFTRKIFKGLIQKIPCAFEQFMLLIPVGKQESEFNHLWLSSIKAELKNWFIVSKADIAWKWLIYLSSRPQPITNAALHSISYKCSKWKAFFNNTEFMYDFDYSGFKQAEEKFYHFYDDQDLSDHLSETLVDSFQLRKIKDRYESMNPELGCLNPQEKSDHNDLK